MFFIGQNLKRAHMTYSFLTFDLLLINSRHLVIGVYFSSHQRNLMGNQSWNTNHELVSAIDVQKTCFLMQN